MKTFTASLVAVSAVLSLTSASPSLRRRTYEPTVTVTLKGATNDVHDQYNLYVPVNGGAPSYNPLSISRVEYDHYKFTCTFKGVDSDKGEAAKPVESNGGQLGPPQGIVYVECHDSKYEKRTTAIPVTLVGAIGAPQEPTDQYTVWVQPGYGPVSTAAYDPRRLSISKVYYDHAGVLCHFTGVNGNPVEANGQLGPPQTITYVECNHTD
jgi:hypothetical protein